MNKEKKIYVVGIGPGSYEGMTGAAVAALEKSDVIVGGKEGLQPVQKTTLLIVQYMLSMMNVITSSLTFRQ